MISIIAYDFFTRKSDPPSVSNCVGCQPKVDPPPVTIMDIEQPAIEEGISDIDIKNYETDLVMKGTYPNIGDYGKSLWSTDRKVKYRLAKDGGFYYYDGTWKHTNVINIGGGELGYVKSGVFSYENAYLKCLNIEMDGHIYTIKLERIFSSQ